MTPLLAPGLIAGSAPPANAPPGLPPTGPPSTSSTGTGDPAAPSAFAALLQAATSIAGAQDGGDTAAPPPGGIPPLPEDTPAVDDLLARLLALAQGVTGEGVPDGTVETKQTNLLLDRLAEAGGEDPAPGDSALDAVEALMAYLVLAQPAKVEPDAVTAIPDGLAALRRALEPEVPPVAAPATAAGGEPDLIAVTAQSLAATATTEVSDASDALATVERILGRQGSEEPSGASLALLTGEGGSQPVMVAAAGQDSTTGAERLAGESLTETVAPAAGAADPARLEASPRPDVTSTAAAEQVAGAVTASLPTAEPIRVETVQARVVNAAVLPAELAETVRVAAFRGDSEVRLVLNPPELGHLDIHIARGEHGLRIVLEASQSAARELLDRSTAGLHQALEARDLRVDRLEVRSADTGRGSTLGGDASTAGQHYGGGASDGSQGGDAPEWSPLAGLGLTAEATSSMDTTSTGPGVAPSSEGGSARAAGSLDVLA